MTIDHVTISAVDLAASLAFYDAALGSLGLVRVVELVDEEEPGVEVEAVGWGIRDARPSVWLVRAEQATTGLHVRFAADSRHEVETFFATAVENGGVGRSAPRAWTLYRGGEFGAMVADPAGNIVEAVTAD